jgi:hypothetical protein
MIKQATRQVEAIIESGTHIDIKKIKPLEWHFAEQSVLEKFRDALNKANPLSNGDNLSDYIKLVHTPFTS